MAYALAVFTTLATCWVLFALWRGTRRRPALVLPEAPPVTVLKPLCGADDDLESNLESFFAQDYPDYELVFGVEGDADPAIPVVRRLQARYPRVASRLVIHAGRRALNPKVSNLRAMLETGSHDVVVVSDSNMAAPAGYLRDLVAELTSGPRVGLVTSLVAGRGEQTVGATFDHLELFGGVAPPVATAARAHRTVAIGKSLAFRMSVFQALGGMESIANLLAEDYVMGRMFWAGGYEVRLAPAPAWQVNRSMRVAGFLRRHMRWALLRSRLQPLTYLAEPLLNPMAVALLALAAGEGSWVLPWGVGLSLVRHALPWYWLRGGQGMAQAIPWSPFKDLVMLGVWALAPWTTRVCWRQRTYRVAAGTHLYACQLDDGQRRIRWEAGAA